MLFELVGSFAKVSLHGNHSPKLIVARLLARPVNMSEKKSLANVKVLLPAS
jgi:hypothetical protein